MIEAKIKDSFLCEEKGMKQGILKPKID